MIAMLYYLYSIFIYLGNPRPHLRPLKEHLLRYGHSLSKKKDLVNIYLVFDSFC